MWDSEQINNAISESIAHHKRMKAWAELQQANAAVNPEVMREAIEEDWYSGYCALCKIIKVCGDCPLFKKYGHCYNETNAWFALNNSKTWGEFAKNEEKMIKQLQSLLQGK